MMIKPPWKPMEAAPKDGTIILAYGEIAGEINGEWEETFTTTIYWSDGRTDYENFNWVVGVSEGYAAWMKPQMWMEIPPR